ncbi:MAG: radical SAM protein [Elusimicrobiales bacterium]|nr:radical SAM protein [Elusimicrobiales bacterium]
MKAIEIYQCVKNYISNKYRFLGVNKRREIERLIFEIFKKNRSIDFSILPEYINYEQFKRELIKIRYPISYKNYPLNSFFLGKIDLDYSEIWKENKYVEIEVVAEKNSCFQDIVSKLVKRHKIKSFKIVNSIKDVIKSIKGNFKYDNRKRKFYITSERFDFIKACPCTSNCISCGYIIMNLGFGCPFDCQYCYLSGYQNVDGIIINTNIYDYLEQIKKIKSSSILRIGSGEFTDSLVYDDITNHSSKIINFFRNFDGIIFEFKTKSEVIDNILNERISQNIVVSYSINPSFICDEFEHGCAPYKKRLECLERLVKTGWNIGVHFDPVIYIDNWKNLYRDCLSDLFSFIPLKNIRWISCGTLRFYPHTKKIIEKRFPDTRLLDCEMIIDFDGKLRYPFSIRREIYSFIVENLKKYNFPINKFYLCMENLEMWKEIGVLPFFRW